MCGAVRRRMCARRERERELDKVMSPKRGLAQARSVAMSNDELFGSPSGAQRQRRAKVGVNPNMAATGRSSSHFEFVFVNWFRFLYDGAEEFG